MSRRRDFLKCAGGATAAALLAKSRLVAYAADVSGPDLSFSSPAMELRASATAPELISLNIDGLAKGRRGASALDPKSSFVGFKTASTKTADGLRVEYRPELADPGVQPPWIFEVTKNRIVATSQWSAGAEPVPMTFRFALKQVHTTVLGLFQRNGLLATPAIIHFPGQGSMRLTSSAPSVGLTYTSDRSSQSAALILPGASCAHPRVVYTFEITAIHPDVPGIAGDERFDGFRRNWLDALQVNPDLKALANNSASSTCAFCYYEYADITSLTPPLAHGLTAMDIVKQTLDRALAGGQGYGLPGLNNFQVTAASDTYPSLIIAAANCVRAGGNNAWLAANYQGVRGWAESLLATDKTGNGLTKFGFSGNSGSWPDGFPTFRPSNWWDTIGFGYEDAYGNALAYRAYRNMAMMAEKLGKAADVHRYHAAADRLRAAYATTFLDPDTGVLGGWRSRDGQLHDYYFLWVNGIAIHYGLIEKPQADAIMDKLLAKMKEVGYENFKMGLPGNLITVALKDYAHRTKNGRYGGGVKPDNSDGWQNYENGGATAAFAFFTLAALYDLGRKEEADRILFPMLSAYADDGFSSRDEKGFSSDWRRWDGTNTGYEGLLTDNYYALLAVPLRQSQTAWQSGYRPGTALT